MHSSRGTACTRLLWECCLLALLAVSAVGASHGGALRAAHGVLHAREQVKMGTSMFDQLEKIAAASQDGEYPSEMSTDGAPGAPGVPRTPGDGGSTGAGGPAGSPAGMPGMPPNATQQAMMQMMQGLSVERIEMTPFGKTVPQEPGVRYIIASGQQECMQCEAIIAGAHFVGQSFDGVCEFLGHSNAAVNSKMCHAQAHVLQSCPEFVNDWCYQDFGGSQMLRSPCPPHLICHYCLGLNPLHCQRNYLFPMPS